MSFTNTMVNLWNNMGFSTFTWQQGVMIGISLILLFLAMGKNLNRFIAPHCIWHVIGKFTTDRTDTRRRFVLLSLFWRQYQHLSLFNFFLELAL